MGKYGNHTFERKLVSYVHLPEKFDKIPEVEIIQFTDPLNPFGPIEGPIFQTWVNHLKSVHVPFAVTRCLVDHYEHFIIWKQRVARESQQNKYYKDRRKRLKNAGA